MQQHQFGISVYPEHSTKEEMFAYIECAAKKGFTRVFTCLLSVDKSKEETIKEFTELISFCHKHNFIVSVDTAPQVIHRLGGSALDLKLFHDMGVDILRLDFSFGILFDSFATRNPYGIRIEFNGSNDAGIETMIDQGANPGRICISHNFFPQEFTGLSVSRFKSLNQKWNALHLPVAAFISSQQNKTFGPWPVYDGLVTCEAHRHLPIDVQARHMIACGNVTNFIIGNAYASDDELSKLVNIDTSLITFRLDHPRQPSLEENHIIYDLIHQGRSDCSDMMIRSSYIRFTLKERSITPYPCSKEIFERGDVLIVNNNLEHYSGELHVVLEPFENKGNHNLVGSIRNEELIILDELTPNKEFKFIN